LSLQLLRHAGIFEDDRPPAWNQRSLVVVWMSILIEDETALRSKKQLQSKTQLHLSASTQYA